jgi:hypothetical protein
VAKLTLAHYLRFLSRGFSGDSDYIPNKSFQNFFANETRTFGGATYQFAPFRMQEITSARGGETPESSIVTVPSPLTLGIVGEAAQKGWLAEIKTVLITVTEGSPPTFTEGATLTETVWSCASMTAQIDTAVTLRLTSGFDLIQAQVPRRALSSYLVGGLPTSGAIFSS